ncbi:MAG: DUF3011 domain-containing protein [Xanthomonadales bacterium]|nr:hypothetical protein [Xanthomonadales bacterium]MCC6592858.1 DUF3011 domain-containing protein [Xanthomonadales bacterium]MCE7931178.1 DUF3011 domain-containing protein [Xanthomonadales bacterium PRO6]
MRRLLWTFSVVLLWMTPALASAGVVCESREGGYRECYSGFRGPPVLVRQLSDSSCVEGRSWGHRPGAIWVSRGCRAVFEERGGGGWTGGTGDSIVCESRDGRYNECRTGFRGAVELVEQYSSSQCVEGRSWGRTRGGVWVDRGCRARFASYYGGDGGYDGGGYWQPSGGGYTIECESRDNRQRSCSWDWNAGTPYLVDQLSSSPCVRGRSWGYDRGRGVLWVDQGCRAVFGAR